MLRRAIALIIFNVICGSVYALLAIADFVPMNSAIFAAWITSLLASTTVLLFVFRRHNSVFGWSVKLKVILWLAIAYWFWIAATTYQFLNLTMDRNQLKVYALAYIWEVPVLGALFIWTATRILKPVTDFVDSGQTNSDLPALYKKTLRFPIIAAILISVFSTIGYILGTIQTVVIAQFPLVECIKDTISGGILALFSGLFYYIILDILLEPVRQSIKKAYTNEIPTSRSFYKKLLGVMLVMTLSSLILTSLFILQGFQSVVQDSVTDQLRARLSSTVQALEQATPNERASILQASRIGAHGQAYSVDAGDFIPLEDVSQETYDYINSRTHGETQDNKTAPDAIVFTTSSKLQKKIVLSANLYDFYSPLTKVSRFLLIASAYVVVLTVLIITVFSRLVIGPISRLVKAVQAADNHTFPHNLHISTADEFEELSEAFKHFIRQSQNRTHQLEQERARLESSISSLRIGFILTDSTDKMILGNAAVTRIMQSLKSPAISDQNWSFDDIQEALSGSINLKKKLSTCLEQQKIIDIKEVNIGPKTLRILISPIISKSSRKSIGGVILIEDVTEEQVLLRSRDEFFSIASHELRTPLTAIRGNTSLIMSMYDKQVSDPDIKSMLNDIHESSVRLIAVVNDFLSMSQLEQGKAVFKPESFQIEEIINGIRNELHEMIKEKSLTFEYKPESKLLPNVWADKDRVKQILYNLIGNCIKFTNHGGIFVTTNQTKSTVKVTIRDTGQGIPIANQKLLFHKFQQAGESLLTRDTTRGTGLGLYISRLIIENMGGTIGMEKSEEGKGTTFSFTLPIATDGISPPPISSTPPSVNGQSEVL